MTIAARAPVLAATLLKLGRVSNLPTVWTNVLAGAVLSGGDWRNAKLGVMFVAMSLFYIGGMYLNDYFDRAIDERERPERPIPSGDIAAFAVAAIGFVLIGAGAFATAAMGPAAAAMAALLAVSIVAYDWHHKGNPFAPVVMGACRALVYGATATALSSGITIFTAVAAVAVGAFVAGLTYAARQENLDQVGNLWPLLLLISPLGSRGRCVPSRSRGARDLFGAGRLHRCLRLSAGKAAGRRRGLARGRSADRRHLAMRRCNHGKRGCHRACARRARWFPADAGCAEICGWDVRPDVVRRAKY